MSFGFDSEQTICTYTTSIQHKCYLVKKQSLKQSLQPINHTFLKYQPSALTLYW